MLDIVLVDTERLPYKVTLQLQEELASFGMLKSYRTTEYTEIVPRCIDAEVILVNKILITKEHLVQLPKLKYIVVVATGYNNVDIEAAHELGIQVSNVPNYSTVTVAQHSIAFMLELSNSIGKISQIVKTTGQYLEVRHKNLELSGLTLGVVGFGNIAQCVIKIALALGMNIIVNSRKASYLTDLPVKFVNKEFLFTNSDFISLHCPLTSETKYLVNQYMLSLMKPTAYIINTARGGLIYEPDLVRALSNKQIAGAALDVLEQEPPELTNQLLTLDNCILTPHNSWISTASLLRWKNVILDNIHGYKSQQLINLVV